MQDRGTSFCSGRPATQGVAHSNFSHPKPLHDTAWSGFEKGRENATTKSVRKHISDGMKRGRCSADDQRSNARNIQNGIEYKFTVQAVHADGPN